MRAPRDEFEDRLRRVLDDLVAAGEFAIEDPALAMRGILGMVNHSPQWFDPAGRLTADQVADGFCDVLLGGLRTSGA